MKKSILTLLVVFLASLGAFAQQIILVDLEDAKVVHRLFQSVFQPSCSALSQLAICDFNLQNNITVSTRSTFDYATLSVTTLPSPAAKLAARNLTKYYGFDYSKALESASILENWVKRMQSHSNMTSRAEYEMVYELALGVRPSQVLYMNQQRDQSSRDLISESISSKFNTSPSAAKSFVDAFLISEPAQ